MNQRFFRQMSPEDTCAGLIGRSIFISRFELATSVFASQQYLFIFVLSFLVPPLGLAEERGFNLQTWPATTESLAKDIADIASYGGTLARFQVHLNRNQDVNYWIPLIRSAESVCYINNMVLAIDLHGCNFIPAIDPRSFETFWSTISFEFRNNLCRIRYELINEPVFGNNEGAWRRAFERAASAIARNDKNPDHKVAVPTDCTFGYDFSGCEKWSPLDSIAENRQWVVSHCYVWNARQHNSNGVYPDRNANSRALRIQIQRIKDIQNRHQQVRCFVSEIAFHQESPSSSTFMTDALGICKELNIHACVHSFRESDWWNYESVRSDNNGLLQLRTGIQQWLGPQRAPVFK